MTDPLDDLKQAFDAATPAPDARRREATLAEAEKVFRERQGTVAAERPTFETGKWSRFRTGVRTMTATLTSRGGLTATTALVAVVLVAITPAGRSIWMPPEPTVLAESELVREEAREVVTPAPESLADFDAPVAERGLAQLSATQDATAPAARIAAQPMLEAPALHPEADEEAFANAPDSGVVVTLENPVSTFSIDVDTASYSIVRSFLERGDLPPPEAVRIEEMVNYFTYDYPAPKGDVPFSTSVSVTPTPWNRGTELVQIGLQGVLPAIEDRPPLNLVFLVDTSGSMQDPTKLPLLRQSLLLMLPELRPEDEIAIVAYAGSAGEVLEPTAATDVGAISEALGALEAGGATAGAEGIELAYRLAGGMAEDGEVSRVILATDGDFNVGISDPEALEALISDRRESGVYLSVFGFGRGNLDDATMQALAQAGNGQAAYIDTLSEARKVLVDQLTGALFPIANDVKVQVEFNPAEIAEYRLIGYETRALRREDFTNDRVDAGDIGAGHSVTAIYEVTPVGSEAILNAPLRYGNAIATGNDGEIGFVKLRYKTPGEDTSALIETAIPDEPGPLSQDARFATAIAGFGQLLRGGAYLNDWGWDDAIALARDARGEDPFGYRAEAVELMRLAEALSR